MLLTNWLFKFKSGVRPHRRKHATSRPGVGLVQTESLEERVLLAGDSLIAVPFASLPGQDIETVAVDAVIDRVHSDVVEVGFFVMDSETGAVGGVGPDDSGYQAAVFESSSRQTLYERENPPAELPTLTFTGGESIGVYFLQESPGEYEFADILRTVGISSSLYQIGWEEEPPLWPETVGVGDRRYDDFVLTVTVGDPVLNDCAFHDDLSEWTVTESGGTDTGHGDVTAENCIATLVEGDSFITTLETTFTVPADAESLSFEFANLNFDTTDTGFIRDAFEAALVDQDGNPLVDPFLPGRDSFLNITEGVSTAFGNDTEITGTVVTVDVSDVLAGEEATLIFRLTGDDADTNSTVQIVDYGIPGIRTRNSSAASSAQARTTESIQAELPMAIPVAGAVAFDGAEMMGMRSLQAGVPMLSMSDMSSSEDSMIGRSIQIVSPVSEAVTGTRVTIVGEAHAYGMLDDASQNSITNVTVNGVPVGFLSLDGTFTSEVTIESADNVFQFQAVDSTGGSVEATVTLIGLPYAQSIATNSNSNIANDSNASVLESEATFASAPLTADGFALPQVEFVKNTFDVLPESNHIGNTPSIIDLNDDDIPDIVFYTHELLRSGTNTEGNSLRAISGDDGSELWTISEPDYSFFGYAQTAVADIDLDGRPEIIAAEGVGTFSTLNLIAFEHDGTFKWRSPAVWGGVGLGGPSIADLDADGVPEIVIGGTVINSTDGTIRWEGRDAGGVGIGGIGFGPLSLVVDLDLDGAPEVVAGNSAYRADGELFWNASVGDGYGAIGNFDDDLFPEIVHVSNGSIYILEHDGQIQLGPISMPDGSSGGPPTVADFDNDGIAEFGVAGGRLYATFEADGTVLWTQPIQDLSSRITGSSVFDFDGNGTAEVVYGDERFLRIFNGSDGEVLYELAKSSCTGHEYPVVVDVDGDGQTEIVAVANSDCGKGPENGLYVIGSEDWVPTRQIWNQHSYHITNINDDGSVPRVELNSWELYNNYRRNLQPTGTQVFPPTITASAAASTVNDGTQLVISGLATANGSRPDGTQNQITYITANGKPVQVLDSAGAFFEQVTVLPGVNTFTFTAHDSVGQTATTTVTITGTQGPDDGVDLTQFEDVTGSFSGVYGRTSFNSDNHELHVNLATRNDGSFESDVPLLVGISNISDPSVSVVGASGITDSGMPYFDFTEHVADGRLAPGEMTASPVITFSNSNRRQFDYELVFLGQLNDPPFITTLPDIESLVGRTYLYDVDATDPNGDVLTYSLLAGPAAMTLDPATGEISWSPGTPDLGNHVITVQADDSRGGQATQTYTLSVIEPPPNRPPIITSTPVTQAEISTLPVEVAEEPFDLSQWNVVQLGPSGFTQAAANWAVAPDGASVLQTVNANASLLISDIDSQNEIITGEFSVETTGDDDFIGFVFGYQDSGHFYLFDWKQGTQSFGSFGTAERGMTVKRVSADTPLRGPELWDTDGAAGRVTPLYHNTLGWSDFTDYSFSLAFEPGEFTITVMQGETVLDSFSVEDDVYQDGKFGFYNYSQGSVSYSGFTTQDIIPPNYIYDVTAQDADGDRLTYSLSESPEGMEINSLTGRIGWRSASDQVGNHDVVVSVSDGNGGIAEQRYVVCVHPDPLNNAPTIVTTPLMDYFVPGAQATAGGSVFITGHDSDWHATQGVSNAPGARNILRTAVDYITAPEANPFVEAGIDRILFVESSIAAPGFHHPSTEGLESIGLVEGVDFEHHDATSLAGALDELGQTYGALIVASNFGGLLTQAELDILNARADDISSFVNQGGGLLALAESDTAFDSDLTPAGGLFDFLPFLVEGNTENQTESGVTLTHFGMSLGLTEFDVNGNVAHAVFADDAGLNIVDIDSQGRILSLAGRGIIATGGVLSAIPYEYEADAVDPDDDQLTWSLIAAPDGMTIDESTGRITWSPFANGDARVSQTLGDADFFGFNSGIPGDDVPTFDFNNSTPEDPLFTDRDLRQSLDGDDSDNDIRWTHDLSANLPTDTVATISDASLTLVIGGIQDGDTQLSTMDDRLFIEEIEVASIFDELNQGANGTGVVTIDLTAEQVDKFIVDGILNVFFDGGKVPVDGSSPGRLESYFIDFATFSFTSDAVRVGVSVADGRGGADEQGFSVSIVKGDDAEIHGTKFNDLNGDGIQNFSEFIRLSVTGTSDPWLAGASDGTTASVVDVAPDQSPINVTGIDIARTSVLHFTADGVVSNGPGSGSNSPDGGGASMHGTGAENGLSDVIAPINSLIGVFLNSTEPALSSAVAPESLDFRVNGNVAGGINYDSLAPALRQVFFIGDGLTVSGQQQSVAVPDGATRLFLGTMDGFEWANNTGSFDVAVSALEPGISGWQIYLDENGNARKDTGEPSTVTDSDGQYLFAGLPDRVYVVREEPQTGWRQTFPAEGGIASHTVSIEDEQPIVIDFDSLSSGRHEGTVLEVDGVRFVSGTIPNTVDVGTVVSLSNAVEEFDVFGNSSSVSPPNFAVARGGDGNDLLVAFSEPVISVSLTTDQGSSEAPDVIRLLALSPTGPVDGFTVLAITEGYDNAVSAPLNRLSIDLGGLPFSYVLFQTTTEQEGFDDLTFVTAPRTFGIDFGNVSIHQGVNEQPKLLSVPTGLVVAGALFEYSVIAVDPENDLVSFSLPVAPDGMTIHPSLGTVVWLPTESQVGSHEVLLRVKDDRGGSAVQQFTVDVSLPNNTPVFTSVPPSSASVDRGLSYPLAAQDADGDDIAFSIESPLPGMQVVEVVVPIQGLDDDMDQLFSAFTWTPQSGGEGDHTVTVIAADPHGAETRQTFSLSVTTGGANSAPEILSSPRTVARLGRIYSYVIDADDADKDALSYSVSDGPTGLDVNSAGIVTWTPLSQHFRQSFPVTVRVTDGQGQFDEQTYSIQVTSQDRNSTPRITSTPKIVASLDHEYAYDVVGLDQDRDPLQFSLPVAPRGMSINRANGTIRWTPDDQQLGEHSVVIEVTDTLGATSTQRFIIDVVCNNSNPSIVSSPPTQATVDQPYLYAVRAEDAEGDRLSFSFSTDSSGNEIRPDGMQINPQTGVILWAPTVALTGSHTVHIRVEDEQGGLNTQQYTVVASLADQGTINQPPVIFSTPVFNAEAGTLYRYDVGATDPDGDPLTFSVKTGPAGMEIDASGVITFTPVVDVETAYSVVVEVSDDSGAVATQGFALDVTVNEPPTIQSVPVTIAVTGATYRYNVRAVDPDSDPLTWRLSTAPDGMTIDQFGRIIWQTDLSDIGTQNEVVVVVTDNRGQSATQTFSVAVAADTTAPAVVIELLSEGRLQSTTSVDQGSVFQARVVATDNVGVSEITLTANGEAVSLDRFGTVTLSAALTGEIPLLATAADASGNVGQTEVIVTVVDPSGPNRPIDPGDPGPQPVDPDLPPHPGFDPTDNLAPIVTITNPAPASPVTNTVEITGTVNDPEDNLWYYRVYTARADRVALTGISLSDPDWQLIGEGTEEVHNGKLADFDPSMLSNDPYAVIVAAFDGNGKGFIQPTVLYVEGNVQVGNFRLEFTDLSIPLAGIPIQVTRVYDTVNAPDQGDFGFGWSLGVQDARILEVAAVGSRGVLNPGNNAFVPDVTKVYLTNPSGQRVGYTYREQQISVSFFGGIFRPYFQPDPGVYDTLAIDQTQVGRGGVIGALTQGVNPSFYNLTTKNGLTYRYSDSGGLQTITDLNGNIVTFTDDGISHSSGMSIDFVRDHRDRITQVIDPAGNAISYSYNLAGDLRSYTDQAGLRTTYSYLDAPAHYLDEASDPLGRRVLKAVYEENPESRQHEFKGIVDADGNRIDSREFDTDNNTGVVRDANGNPTTLHYDDRGNVLREVDPLGNTTFREYDDARNPDLETRIIDRVGNITEQEYDARGNLMRIVERGTETNPLAEPTETSITYDNGNRVTSITNATNATTTFRYDSRGNLTRITNAEQNSSSLTYDANGRRDSFTDFNGNTTTFTYTAGDQPTTVTNADGTYQVFAYNTSGQVTIQEYREADDTLVERRETRYDRSGRAVAEISGVAGAPNHPQTIVRRIYDGHLLDWEIIVHPDSIAADGSLLESPATPVGERKSRITDFEYDSSDRLIRQIDAEGGSVDFRYDAQGNRVALRDPVGNITTWVYDAFNRVAEERDPFYWVDMRASDPTLAALSDDDYLDHIAPVVSVSSANPGDPLYDDPSGADINANQGADHVRVFGYDTEGNQSKTIDRNGRRREFEYDYASRLIVERWYNSSDHATAPDALVETITFTYDTLGNMLTATDSNSNYLFTYDTLNRLESVDNNPDGTRDVPHAILTYGYDTQGNVTFTQDNSGVTVESTYNRRNQLETRKWFDADGSGDVDDARVGFQYNAAGRESAIQRYSDLTGSNLVGSTTRTYDLAGRSDLLRHDGPLGALLASYDYDYDFSGLLIHEERSHQDTQFTQSIDYAYDLSGQMTDALFTGQDDEHYEYDANGNRLFSQVGSDQRIYTHGTANQLQSDSQYRYEYDGEGNVKRRTHVGNADSTTFTYDHRHRLLTVDVSSDGTGEYSYQYDSDMFGRRIRQSKSTAGSIPVTDAFLTTVYTGDAPWADNPNSTESRRYLTTNRVDELVATSDTSERTKWILADRIRSTRNVIDDAGNTISTITYTTFGSVLSEGTTERHLFTGREIDLPVGSYHYRSRQYFDRVGTFGSQDAIGFAGDDTNLYRYTHNSPVNATDPTGNVSLVAYANASLQLVNGPALGLVGFFHGFSFATFRYLGYYLQSGNRAASLDALLADTGQLIGFNWIRSVANSANGIQKFIPVNPLGLVGTYVGGFSSSGKVQGALIKVLSAQLVEEGHIALSVLLEQGNAIHGFGSALKPPTYSVNTDDNLGGFINGIRQFLRLLV